MSVKAVVPRAQARRDVDEAIDHYLGEAGEKAALGFIDDLERVFSHVAHRPAAGSPRYAHALDLPGLRSWPLKHYPYLVFYTERGDSIPWEKIESLPKNHPFLQRASNAPNLL